MEAPICAFKPCGDTLSVSFPKGVSFSGSPVKLKKTISSLKPEVGRRFTSALGAGLQGAFAPGHSFACGSERWHPFLLATSSPLLSSSDAPCTAQTAASSCGSGTWQGHHRRNAGRSLAHILMKESSTSGGGAGISKVPSRGSPLGSMTGFGRTDMSIAPDSCKYLRTCPSPVS